MRDLAVLPVAAVQGLWVAARATRLPEAAGPRSGRAGQGRPVRLLVVGDSSAAGVGVDHQDTALAGALVRHLGVDHHVDWQVWAKSGATTASALRTLRRRAAHPFDVAVIALGVNDTKNGMRLSRWRAGYGALVDMMRDRFAVRRIYATGVPPLGAVPLLPEPLRGMLGARATRFDAALAAAAAATSDVVHVPFDMVMDPALMAADGFHPGAPLYDLWGARLAELMRADPLT